MAVRPSWDTRLGNALYSKHPTHIYKHTCTQDKLLNMLGIVARAAANVAPDEEAEADVRGAWAKKTRL